MVLGFFPKGIFPKHFPKGDFSIDIFLYGNFPNVHNFPSSNFPKVMLGFLRRRRLQLWAKSCGYDGLGGQALRLEQALQLGQIWEVAAWEIVHLGISLGKIPLES